MKRRRLLQTLGALPAGSLLRAQQPVVPPRPTPAAVEEIPVIESTIPDIAAGTVAGFFSREQFAALRKLSDVVAPGVNGVPGAVEAKAPEFLDFLISESPRDRQENYREGLDELNRRARQKFGVPFSGTNKAQADSILAPLCEPWTATPDKFSGFLRTAKQDILTATQNSHEWVRVMAKRVRSAGGVGMYWFPIE